MTQGLRMEWRTVAVLLVASLIGVVAVFPLVFDLMNSGALGQTGTPDIPMPLVLALALLQNGVLLTLAIIGGLALARRVGLKLPLLSAWARRESIPSPRPILKAGVLGGLATGALMVALDAAVFLPHFPPALRSFFDVPLWKRLLAGLVYGGITEEVLMRLFLVSLVAWLLGLVWKSEDGRPAAGAFWTAIALVAILFGLGHLPVTAAMTPLTPMVVARALLLNGVAGVAFGYLFWRHGLEAAMVGHASAHLVLQIPGAMLMKMLL